MSEMQPSPSPRAADARIKDEIIELAALYDIDPVALGATLGRLDFERYAEYVLDPRNLEIITGGVGQAAALAGLARGLRLPDPIVARFERCAARFPGKMVGLKLCFGPDANEPTLYLNLMEPWDEVFSFLETLPEAAPALDSFRALLGRSSICTLLAFSLDRASGEPVVKTYHAFDRGRGSAPMPLIASYRLADGAVLAQPKYYDPLSWTDLPDIGGSLARVATAAAAILARGYQAALGYHLAGGERADAKLYIFRQDVRSGPWKPRHDSLYTSEGNVLMGLGRFGEAIVAYDNAIDLDAGDFFACANRGLCHALSGDPEAALADAEAAKALEPEMRFRLSTETSEFVRAVADLSRRIAAGGDAAACNQRGIMLFSRGLFALAARDFEAAIRLAPDHAEAHNNLGGACVNLGRYAEAFDSCGKALSLDDTTDGTNYLLALDGLRQAAAA